MLCAADVLNFGVSAAGWEVADEVASTGLADGEIGDLTIGLLAIGVPFLLSTLVSNLVMVGVGDLTPRLMGGGVAPSESSESSELEVSGEDRFISGSLWAFTAAPGLEPTLSGAGVAIDCGEIGVSFLSLSNGAEDSAGWADGEVGAGGL